MATKKLGFADLEDILIKTECESDVELEPEKSSMEFQKASGSAAKCGDIFVFSEGEFIFCCSFCDKKFRVLDGFLVHVRDVHMDDDCIFGPPNFDRPPPLFDSDCPMSGEQRSKIKMEYPDPENEYSDLASKVKIEFSEYSNGDESNQIPDNHCDPDSAAVKQESFEQFSYELNPNVYEEDDSQDDQTSLADDAAEDKNLVCIICKKRFLTVLDLMKHRVALHGTSDGMTNNLLESMTRYKPFSGKDSRKPMLKFLQCRYCDQKFKQETKLLAHEQEHRDNPLFPCDLCPEKFQTAAERVAHMESHPEIRPNKCPECPAAFRTKPILDLHRKTHHAGTVHQCKLCENKFPTDAEKTAHLTKRVTGEGYQCPKCTRKFTNCFQLITHQKMDHVKIKPYSCQLCGNLFSSQATLKKHRVVHTGERPHRCSTCDLTFTRKDILQAHEKIHSGIKSYVCKKCGKAFTQRAGLYGHKRKHYRPYPNESDEEL